MAQHDFIIDNQTFPLTRADINLAIKALLSGNSGASEPATMYPWMDWIDTTNNLWKRRNPGNDDWLTLAKFNLTDDRIEIISDIIQAVSAAGVTLKNSSGTTLFSVDNSGQVTVTGTIAGLAAASAKTTPIDADSIMALDSAASNILKKITWANIKATLKTYFDLIYAVQATETVKGVAELATQAEAEAGSDDLAMMTALKTKQAIAVNGFSGQLLHIRDEKASGTDGGTFTFGAWQTRDQNVVLTNEIVGASLSANQITLPDGEYYIECDAPAYDVGFHKAKLRNVSDSTDTIIGTSAFSSTTYNGFEASRVSGRFTLASAKTFETQHRCQSTKSGSGFGLAGSFGVVEVYTDIKIWRIS